MYGTHWTGELVAARLVAAFRGIRGAPIYSPLKGDLRPIVGPIDGLDLVMAVKHCLGRDQDGTRRLLRWARSRADGTSIREFCRENGRNRSTYYYRRRKALHKVALWLNLRAASGLSIGPPPYHSALVHRGQIDGADEGKAETYWSAQS